MNYFPKEIYEKSLKNFLNKYRDDDPVDAEIKRVNPKLPKYNYYFVIHS